VKNRVFRKINKNMKIIKNQKIEKMQKVIKCKNGKTEKVTKLKS